MVDIEEVFANLLCRLELPCIVINVVVDIIGAARNLVKMVALLELYSVSMQEVLSFEIAQPYGLVSVGLVFWVKG